MLKNRLKSNNCKRRIAYNVYYRPFVKSLAQQRGGALVCALGLALPAQPAGKISLFHQRNLRVHNSRRPAQRPGHNQAGLRLLTPVHSTYQSAFYGVCLLDLGQRPAALQGFYRWKSNIYLSVNQKIQRLRTWQPAFIKIINDILNVIQCVKFTRIFFAVNHEYHSLCFNAPGGIKKPASQSRRVSVSYVGAAGLGLAK